MKLLKIKVGDKTHTIGKVSAFVSREIMKIQKETIGLTKLVPNLQNEDDNAMEKAEAVMDLLERLSELRERKAWLLSEAYGKVFTPEELEKNLTDQEIEMETNRLIFAVTGVISKN